jgi:hypothetical protein
MFCFFNDFQPFNFNIFVLHHTLNNLICIFESDERKKDYTFNNFHEHCFKREYIVISYSLIKNFHKFEIVDISIKNKLRIILSIIIIHIHSIKNFFNQEETWIQKTKIIKCFIGYHQSINIKKFWVCGWTSQNKKSLIEIFLLNLSLFMFQSHIMHDILKNKYKMIFVIDFQVLIMSVNNLSTKIMFR